MKHVDDFIDDVMNKEVYARWFFLLHRLPAVYKASFSKYIEQYKLFCTYEGKRYRVTGASRMGDVWLTADFNREVGYELRVELDNCKDWSDSK